MNTTINYVWHLGVIRIRKSKKADNTMAKKKKNKGQNMVHKTSHIKLKIE